MADHEVASSGQKRAGGKTRALVKDYAAKGLGPSEIGRLVGISRAAAADHMKRLRRDGELPDKGAA